jgi:hypothetical protein
MKNKKITLSSLSSIIGKIYGPKGTPRRDIYEKQYAEKIKALENKSK